MRLPGFLFYISLWATLQSVGISRESKDTPEAKPKQEAGPDAKALKEFETKVQNQIAERVVKEAKEKAGAAPVGPPQIMVIVEMIEVEHDDFSEWIQENPLRTEATELRAAVQTWVKAKRGKIRETMVVAARSGQRAKAEGIDELIYPTEYTQAGVPNTLTLQGGEGGIVTPPSPQTFEVRNVGVTLEVDPVLGQNGEIDLNLSPELVHHIEDKVIETSVGDSTQKVTMPIFHTVKMTTQVRVISGSYAFLGTSRLPEKVRGEALEDSLLLIFVRADAL